jgi:hypothetical protein
VIYLANHLNPLHSLITSNKNSCGLYHQNITKIFYLHHLLESFFLGIGSIILSIDNLPCIITAASQNQWIFRTGWTPQPDPLAFITSGWCNHCGSCVKKDLNQCPSCSIEPLVTTRQQQRLFGIEENGSGEKRKRTGPN